MIDVLMIADDLTGALDASAPFMASGVEVRTDFFQELDLACLDPAVSVLAINAATRHLDPAEAGERVEVLVDQALKAGVPWIVKKTDSVLRGNVGAELGGMFAAAPGRTIQFLPAFPAMGRTTRGGLQYVDGVPLAQTSFAHDPFEPVRSSDVCEILADGTEVPVCAAACGDELPASFEGIAVYDAETDDDLDRLIRRMAQQDAPHLLAGCAGAMASLARLLAVPEPARAPSPARDGLLVYCGSVNPVSLGQCERAAQAGATRRTLSSSQILEESWCRSEDFRRFSRDASHSLQDASLLVVDAGRRLGFSELVAAGIAETCDARSIVASRLGTILDRLLSTIEVENVLVMGGDVLLAFLESARISRLFPKAELEPGVVVSEFSLGGRRVRLASKSGGFGDPDLFLNVYEKMSGVPFKVKEFA